MKKSDIAIIGFLIIGLGFGYFYDIQIARTLFNPHDEIGLFVQDYGNHLPYGIALFALLGLSINETNLLKKSLIQTLAILFILFNAIYLSYHLSFKLQDTLGFSLIFAYGLWFLVTHVKRFKTNTFKKWFKFILVSFILMVLIPNVLKLFILRFRPYMFMGGCLDYSFYLKWLPFNTDENFRSFPSYHVSMSGMMMVFVSYPMISEKYKRCVIVLSLVFISFIAYYRMVVGAHFLSDVMMSVLIDYLILRWVYLRIVK
jgi:membrane-associated phospholipid phosphatase